MTNEKINVTNSIKETREIIKKWKNSGLKVGFVPTMGYLHDGHESLIIRSAEENDKTVVSIFVNPTQFAPSEDFNSYPRNFDADKLICQNAGADLIFAPTAKEMYPEGSCTFVDMDKTSKGLCGKSRPTHFRGVSTVVNKLFNITTPNRAYFGQKDAQQLAVIKKMTTDLCIDVEIIGCPIVREADGLAKSSRNVYLSSEERKAALVLSKALNEGRLLIKSGECDKLKLLNEMEIIVNAEPLAKIDYIEIVDADSIEPINDLTHYKGNILIAIAVFIGKTRLIDNFIYNMEETAL